MIQKSHRFHGQRALHFVYQRGYVVRGPLLSLKFVRNERIKTHRAAVVVSRKVSKSAVVRNRIRRRIYEVLRSIEPQISAPYDLVFLVSSEELSTIEHPSLQAALAALLTKAGVLAGGKRSANIRKNDIVENKETSK